MGQTNYFRLFAIVAYTGLAGLSCKWTAESLYLSMPTLRLWGAWLLAITIYVISSIIFAQFLNSLDTRKDFYGKPVGRFGTFALSLAGLLAVWVAFCVSTNSHSLIHNDEVRTVLVHDLSTTGTYLTKLNNKNAQLESIDKEFIDFSTKIHATLAKLQHEYVNPGRRGYADSCRKYRRELEVLFNTHLDAKSSQIVDPGRTSTSNAADFITVQTFAKLELVKQIFDNRKENVSKTIKSDEIYAEMRNIDNAINDVNNMDGISFNILESADKHLENGYARIKNNAEYINFDNREHKERYTAEKPVTRYDELKSVKVVVWDGIMHGKYREMYYWILIAILVDVAGFIFFKIAFPEL